MLSRETNIYDKTGNRTKQILPLGYEEIIIYDADGKIISKTDFNGNKIEFEYDTSGNLRKKHIRMGSMKFIHILFQVRENRLPMKEVPYIMNIT